MFVQIMLLNSPLCVLGVKAAQKKVASKAQSAVKLLHNQEAPEAMTSEINTAIGLDGLRKAVSAEVDSFKVSGKSFRAMLPAETFAQFGMDADPVSALMMKAIPIMFLIMACVTACMVGQKGDGRSARVPLRCKKVPDKSQDSPSRYYCRGEPVAHGPPVRRNKNVYDSSRRAALSDAETPRQPPEKTPVEVDESTSSKVAACLQRKRLETQEQDIPQEFAAGESVELVESST